MTTRNARRIPRPRRGATMMMVLVSLGAGTILTTAYLASRDNASMIGENVVASTTSQWESISGAEIGLAILQTETAWRTSHVAGKLVDDYALGQGTLDLDIVDLETDQPPTDETELVRLTATTVVNGIEHRSSIVAQVPIGAPQSADVDLSEFAVFTRETLELQDDATITRWPVAPASGMGRRIAVGTQATAASSIKLSGNAAAIDTTVYHDASASGALVSNGGLQPIDLASVPGTIPFPNAVRPPVLPPDGTTHPDETIAAPTTLLSDMRYGTLTVGNKSVLTLQGDVTLVTDDDLRLETETGLLVTGDADLVVFGHLELADLSWIELQPGATLRVWVAGNVTIKGGYVGNARADRTIRDASGTASWMDPERLLLTMTEPLTQILFENGAVVKMNLYAPKSTLLIRGDSALYGRVAVSNGKMQGVSAIFYDHGLDSGFGYTNFASYLYEDNGDLKANLSVLLTSLEDSVLASLADQAGLVVMRNGDVFIDPDLDLTPVAALPGDPTPRPIPVEYEVVQLGADTVAWEDDAALLHAAAAHAADTGTDLATAVEDLITNIIPNIGLGGG